MAHLDYENTFAAHTSAYGGAIYTTLGKRGLDLLLAILLLPFLLPLIMVLWCLAKLDGGPGFFSHRRVGQNGYNFTCWKIRTMVPDAEKRLAEHLAADPVAKREWEATCKLGNDPRITPLGRFLRRTSLDELPQIFNVLRGDMSLVGPRPITRTELSHYGAAGKVYLSLRPGVTGLWQVRGRSNGCYVERVGLDVEYGRALSLALDLALIARTALVIVRPTGR